MRTHEEQKAIWRVKRLAQYHRTKKLRGRKNPGVQAKGYYKAWRINAKQCMDCGFVISPANYFLIDADHRPGEVKRFNVSNCHKWGLQATIDELAKCDPVCCRCHRIRTYQRSNEFAKKGWLSRQQTDEQLQLQL